MPLSAHGNSARKKELLSLLQPPKNSLPFQSTFHKHNLLDLLPKLIP